MVRDWEDPGRARQFVRHFVDIEAIKNSNAGQFKPPEEMTDREFEALKIPLQTDFILQEFGERMIRALFYNDYGVRITGRFQRKVRLKSQLNEPLVQEVEALKAVYPLHSFGGNAFRWFTVWNKPKGTLIGWMQFYEGTEIVTLLGAEQLLEGR